jgi:DNA-binding beta-propeller fold protein YncE
MWKTFCTSCLLGLVTATMLHAQTGTLVVLNKRANTADIIDVESGQTLQTLPTGQVPHEAAISSDGRVVVTTDYGARASGTSLTIIDVPGMRVERTVNLGDHIGPHGIAFLPGDSLVAVTTERTRDVVIVRVADGEVVRSIDTDQAGSHMLALVGDGSTIYTSNMGDNSVAELDVESGLRMRTFTVPPRPEAITVTQDGSEVWVGSNDEGTVNVVDTRTGRYEKVLDGLSWPYRILIAPDNRLVLIPDLQQNELRFIDRVNRRELKRLAFDGAGPQGITLDTFAQVAFLSLNQQDRIAVIDLGTREVIRYIDTGDGPDGIVYSPLVLSSPRE